jgi:putative membrane protein
MEDLPPELNDIVIEEAKRRGLACAIAIDAHNCIEGAFNFDTVAAPTKKAIANVLGDAASYERLRFEVGAAKVTPKEFGVKEGMGPGGISVIIVNVGDKKTAYVTIDGNNMVPNLRERILSDLQKLGVDNGEVFTTDTHIVNAVVMTKRGYHPIGEMIDHEKLIAYVRTAAEEALRTLEPAEASWRQEEASGIKTIGEKQINALSMVADRAAIRAKKSSVIIFPALGMLTIVLLALL